MTGHNCSQSAWGYTVCGAIECAHRLERRNTLRVGATLLVVMMRPWLVGAFQISNTTRVVPNGLLTLEILRRNRSLTALNRQGGILRHIGVGVLDQPWRGSHRPTKQA